mmetsp:Transcript_13023/g.30425  ORF Transcript_13023/g.30425 Transcript_13023/m.30425 type:complete len:449 (+) Transcript_13023:700-2046(+)
MTELSRKLQVQCWQDLPELSTSLECQWGETWTDWAWRLSEELGRACVAEERTLPVQEVSFTHKSISTRFLHGEAAGQDVETLVEDLRRGRVDPLTHGDLVIDAVRYAGKIHSLNNRRLWALQQHQLLLLADGVDVKVRVRILPWTEPTTQKRFLSAFTSTSDGDTVACRTKQAGAPPAAVVATTLGRAVMATSASLAAERKWQRETFAASGPGSTTSTTASCKTVVAQEAQHQEHSLCLGHESFKDWRAAKEHVQMILRKHSSGKPLPEKEFRLLMDVFQYHPDPKGKRLSEVVRVTVGSSEKFANTPCFWIWRADGSGEDISVKKCWDKMDFVEKAAKKRDGKRAVVAGGRRFHGVLDSWVKAKDKHYGFLKFDEAETFNDGDVKMVNGQKVYLEWADVSAATQAWVNATKGSNSREPFEEGQSFSFVAYKWLDTGKLGCKDARVLS